MRVTKYEHACLVLEDAGDTLVIDPGVFTRELEDVAGVVGIVITHEHADHWTPEHLRHLIAANPGAKIFGPAGVASAASGFDIVSVAPGDAHSVGAFALAFFGGVHAEIHRSIPLIDNVGVLVNEQLFYPGDSFTVPEVAVDVLAVPAGAPWLKIGEVIDYVDAVKPKRSFAVHEMVLSDAGKGMAADRISATTESHGGRYIPLEPGDSVEL